METCFIILAGYPKTPLPLITLIISVACIFRGLRAFFPTLLQTSKKRKPVPRISGILYILFGSASAIFSIYVIYAFLTGNKEVVKDFENIFYALIGIMFLNYFLFKRNKEDNKEIKNN